MLRCFDGSFYIGISNNLEARLQKHNDGLGAKYTRSRRPVQLVWSESVASVSAAKKREAALKKLTREQKQELIGS